MTRLELMSRLWLGLSLFLCSNALTAQQFVDVTYKVYSVEHSHQCCTDAAGTGCGSFLGIPLWNRPEPRWIFAERLGSEGAFGPNQVLNPNNLGLDTNCDANPEMVANFPLASHTGVCETSFVIEVESWEEDTGDDNEYDGNIFNPDENHAGPETFTVDFTNYAAGTPHIFSFTQNQNGYVTNIEFTWDYSANQYPEPTVDDASPEVCIGGSTTVSVTSPLSNANNGFQWFSDAALTTQVAVGPSLSISNLLNPATYYVVEVGTSGCVGGSTQVDASIANPPNPPTANDVSTCPGGTATLTATASTPGNTFNWYADANGTVNLGVGSPFTTSSINDPSRTFYVSETDPSTGCESVLIPVVVTTDLSLTAPTATNYTLCQGATTSLTATSTSGQNGTLYWYDNAGLTSTAYVGSPFTPAVFNTAGTYSYWVSERVGGCESPATEVQITVNPLPATPAATDEVVCSGETATLTASGSGGDIFWYSDPSGLNLLNTTASNTFTTATLNSSTTYYYAEINANGCRSPLGSANVTVLPLPSPPNVSPLTVCEGGDAVLSASVASTQGTVTWYDNAGTLLQSSPVPPPSSSYNAGSLAAGFYIFYLSYTAPSGCESPWVTLPVTVLPQPVAPSSIADVAVCQGGTATFNAGQGTFHWYLDMSDTSPYSIGQSFTSPSPLSSSTSYYVSQVVAGCESAKEEVMANVTPALPMPNISSNSPICVGNGLVLNLDDAIDPSLNYAWTGPNGYSSNMANTTFTTSSSSLNSGTYTLTIQDGGGCTASSSIYVDVSAAPAGAPLLSNSPVCEGMDIVLNTSAVPGATYEWTGPGLTPGTSTLVPTLTIANAAMSDAGNYSVVANTGASCPPAASAASVAITSGPAAPTASNISVCEGESITLSATGSGAGVLSYSLMGGAATSPVLGANLPAGTYQYEVREILNGCTSPATPITVTIGEIPAPPTASDVTVCEGENVTVDASVTSGTLLWSNDAQGTMLIPQPTTGTLAAGTYEYYAWAQAASGCLSTSSLITVTVGVNPAMAPTASDINICEGENVVLSATGSGVGTLVYTLPSGTPVSPNVGTGLGAGTYTYQVAEVAGNCGSPSTTITVNVTARPASPIAPAVEVCEGEDISLSAITTATLLWSDDAAGTNVVPTPTTGGLLAGTYVYYAWALENNCQSEPSPVLVTILPTSALAPSTNDITVCEGESVTLQAQAAGTGALNYYDANGNPVSPQLGNNLTAGTYPFTVTESVGNCESSAANLTVTVNVAPSIPGGVGNNGPLCEGEELLLNSPAVANVDYFWTGPNGLPVDPVQNPSFPNVSKVNHQGVYTLVLEDMATGCASTPASTYVQVDATPSGISVGNDGPTCQGGTINLTATGIFGASYEWSGPNGFQSTAQNPLLSNVTEAEEGTYTVAVNIGDCVSTSLETYVAVNNGPSVDAGSDITTTQGQSVDLQASGAVNFVWSPADNLDNPNAANPTFSSNIVGSYELTVVGYNADNCSNSDVVTVTVLANDTPEVVDLFTPNNDGVNDTWRISYLENLKGYTLRVYSRGGVQLLETQNYNNDWDGTYEGNDLPDGTYWYIIKADSGQTYKGAVTMKR